METLKDKIKELEKEEIIKALKECGWVMAKAARRLGITERMIGYKVNKYGIRSKEVRWAGYTDSDENGGGYAVKRLNPGEDLRLTTG